MTNACDLVSKHCVSLTAVQQSMLSGADSLSSLERRRRPHAARGMSRAAAQGPPPGPGGAIAGDANAASLTERGGWEVALSGSCWPTADSRTQRRNVCSASSALHRGLSVSKLTVADLLRCQPEINELLRVSHFMGFDALNRMSLSSSASSSY